MKSFYEFLLNEAPPASPSPASPPSGGAGGSPPPPSSPSPGSPIGTGLGGLSGPGGLGGAPPIGPGASLGGPMSMDPSMGGQTGDPSQSAVKPQIIKVHNVYRALELLTKNKDGHNDKKKVDSK